MATSPTEEKHVHMLVMGYPVPENETFLHLLALHVPGFVRPITCKFLWSLVHPEKTEVPEERRKTVLVGYRYQVRFRNIKLTVTYIVNEDTKNSELFEHFPNPEDHIHCMLTMVDRSKPHDLYLDPGYLSHNIYCQELVRNLEQIVFFIRSPPYEVPVVPGTKVEVSEAEKVISSSLKKTFTFKNCGEGVEEASIGQNLEFNEFCKYLNAVQPINVDDLKNR